MSTYYFAYGSNMDIARMKERMEGEVAIINHYKGILKGYSLFFNKKKHNTDNVGFANIMKEKKGIIEGIVYEISKRGLELLDKLEGGYSRVKIQIEREKGENILCTTYIANKIVEGLKPEKTYMNFLLNGKESLSEVYYDKLQKIETID